jgi:nitrite reductase/ring-hydroxylating ferredoxin subunit
MMRAPEVNGMTDFVEAARLNEVPPGTGAAVMIAGISIALFNVDGTVWAINDTCPHAGSSLVAGTLEGKVVTCASHGWQYDVTTGQLIAAPGLKTTTYPVKVVDGAIFVAIDREACRAGASSVSHKPAAAYKTRRG